MVLADPGLRGKTALVTGGASGIGFGIAEALAREGVDIAVVSRNPDPEAIAHLGRPGPCVAALRADLSVETGVSRVVSEAEEMFGPIDLLVANAATASKEPVTRITTDRWERTIRTNLTGTMWICREVAGRMIRRGTGSILIVGSTAQYHRAPGEAAYHASKAGLASYAESLAVELAPHGIRVNMLVPGKFLHPIERRASRPRVPAPPGGDTPRSAGEPGRVRSGGGVSSVGPPCFLRNRCAAGGEWRASSAASCADRLGGGRANEPRRVSFAGLEVLRREWYGK